MTFNHSCPHCQNPMQVEDRDRGRQAMCPLCNKVVDVPAETSPPTAVSMPYAAAVLERQIGMAVASMICGIVGLMICFPAGLVGLILGIAVLVQASSTPQVERGKGMAIAGIVTGALSLLTSLLIIPILIAILLPSLASAREIAKRTVCASNIQSIETALTYYAFDNEEQFPPNLQVLVDRGHITPDTLVCPSAETPLGSASYHYVTGSCGDCDEGTIILYEDLANHGGVGGNVGFCDGSVRFINDDEWGEVLEKGGISRAP